jgi:hypothetical protein
MLTIYESSLSTVEIGLEKRREEKEEEEGERENDSFYFFRLV